MMCKKKASALWLMISLISFSVFSQERVTTMGIQLKPIVPFEIMNTGNRTLQQNGSTFNIDPRTGYAFGMVIRSGLTKSLSLECGINYVVRNYRFQFSNAQNSNVSTKMLFDGYEIPVVALVFIRLGENLYMNSSFGSSIDFYPTGGIFSNKESYEFAILESNWVQASLLANLGLEYRTKKSGYIYLGASFHRPFNNTAKVLVSQRVQDSNVFNRIFEEDLSGNYLTLDLRYFFQEKPRNKK